MNSQPIAQPLPKAEATTSTNGDLLPNSSLRLTSSKAPPSARRSKRGRWLLLALVGVVVVGGSLGLLAFYRTLFRGKNYYDGLVGEVKVQKLQLRVVERGELESAQNSDIKCEVKTSTKDRGGIKIKWIIEDGAQVKSGDKLIELDKTPLEEELKSQQVTVDKAKAEWVSAEQEYIITQSQNRSDILKAEVELAVAKLELKKYVEGDYTVEKADLEKKIKDATSELKQWQDKVIWSRRMEDLGYLGSSQVIAEIAKLESTDILLKNLNQQLRVLDTYTKQKMLEELNGKVREKEEAVKRAIAQAASKETKADSDRRTKRSIWEQEAAKLEEITGNCSVEWSGIPGVPIVTRWVEGQLAKCVIYAPRDGLVVYYIPQQSRFGRGSQQSIVAVGEPVNYDQKLMQIPNLSKMQVKARVHEAMVKYLYGEDSAGEESHQRANIRVEAFPGRTFRGHVKTVASIASQQDWLSSDVRVYETIVTIDEDLPNKELKPGMSAAVTIVAHETPDPVMTIPIQAVVGSITMGKKRKCYVVHENGYAEERDIEIGLSNESLVEVKSGLKPGEKVALDPTPLLPADGSLRPARVNRDDDSSGDISGGGKKKGKWKGKSGNFKKGEFDKGMPPDGPPFPGKGPQPPIGKQIAEGKSDLKSGNEGPSAEKMAQWMQQFRTATPQKRREMVNRIPEAYRDGLVQKMRSDGYEIAD